MKVGIIVVVYNLSSEIFMLQVAAIRKFCKDDFVIEIFDNSDNKELEENIRYHAGQLGVNYCKIFSDSKGSSDSHAWAANFAYQKLKNKYDAFIFLDHDCLPVCEFSAIEILKGGHVLAGVGQGAKKKYMWPGLLFINNKAIEKDLIDFRPNAQYGLDSGGNLYIAIEKHGEDNCIFFNEAYHQNKYFNSNEYNFFSVLNNGSFYHMVNGSNWAGADRQEERMNSFINIVKEKTGL